MVEGTSKDHQAQPLGWEITQQPVLPYLESLQRWTCCHVPGEVVPVSVFFLTVKKIIFYQDETSPGTLCTCCPLSSLSGS